MKIINNPIKEILLSFLFLFFSCKAKSSDNVEEKNNNISKETVTVLSNQGNKNDTIYWKVIEVNRFFDKEIDNHELEELKLLRVKTIHNFISINNSKYVPFKIIQYESKKYLGKGSLYDFHTEYLLTEYNVDIRRNLSSLEISFEDSSKNNFKPFFLKSGGAVYTGKYLFLYQFDDYIITLEKQEKEVSNFRDVYATLQSTTLPLKSQYEVIQPNDEFVSITDKFKDFLGLKKLDTFSGIKLPTLKNIYPVRPLQKGLSKTIIIH